MGLCTDSVNEHGYVVKLHYGTWEAGKHSTLDLYQCSFICLVLIVEQDCSVWVFHTLTISLLKDKHITSSQAVQ